MQNISLLVLMLSPLGGSPSPQPITPDILARKWLKNGRNSRFWPAKVQNVLLSDDTGQSEDAKYFFVSFNVESTGWLTLTATHHT